MANSRIDIVGKGDLQLIADLYNQVFKPERDVDFFKRRLLGRYNELLLVATVDERAVGFFLGFELKPGIFFEWLYGVLPDYRKVGIASQLMDAVHAWLREHGYHATRMECHNHHRPMLHLAIARNIDILGTRWDPDHHENLVIFERNLEE